MLRKKVANLLPTPPLTGHAQDGCYLSYTQDCSADLSGEHYISKNILEAIGGPVDVTGMPWMPKGIYMKLGINSLKARVLCARHNSALSPLDGAAGGFFRSLRYVDDGLKKTLSRRLPVRLFSGEEIELWMLKTICGMFYGKLSAEDRTALVSTHTLNLQKVDTALRLGAWEDGAGLYMTGSAGETFRGNHSMDVAPLIHPKEPRICGGHFRFAGFKFDLMFDTRGLDISVVKGSGTHRPRELVFEKSNRRSAIILTWPFGTPPMKITMGIGDIPAKTA